MPPVDRRKFPRTHVRAGAVVIAGSQRSEFTVENLSAGGARLVGDLALSAGDRIDVTMQLDSADIRVAATVVRVSLGGGDDIAIAFREPPAETQDRIQQFVLAALARQRAANPHAILVLCDNARVREALERDVAELGRDVVLAATPADAQWALQSRARGIDVAIVDPAAGRELLDHLIAEHPQVHRVGLAETAAVRDEALASGRVHIVLEYPWHPRDLRTALRIES